jgi:hypothetical protein
MFEFDLLQIVGPIAAGAKVVSAKILSRPWIQVLPSRFLGFADSKVREDGEHVHWDCGHR